MSEDRNSLYSQVKAFPLAWKLVAAAVVGLLSVATSGATAGLQLSTMATKVYVADELRKHNEAPRTHKADDPKGVHPPLSEVAALFEAKAAADAEAFKAIKKRDTAILEYLVSIQAADKQVDQRRKFKTAAEARQAFRQLVPPEGDLEPEEAAAKVLGDLNATPQWRR